MNKGKSFEISRHLVFDAYREVKANKGAGGIDGVSVEKFEENLKDNLYKLWNRMSSGSYFPKAVKGVEIPKKNGKKKGFLEYQQSRIELHKWQLERYWKIE